MAKFKLPPISPLIGSNIRTYLKTLSYGRIEVKYYFKLLLSFIVVLIGYPFRNYESFHYRKKIKNYKHNEDPVFIIGHWRSGTTLLHNLLARDNNFGFVTTYQSVFANNLNAKFVFRRFMKAHIPDTRPGDNVKLAVNFPQEDEFAISNMNPLSYYQFMYLPENYSYFYDHFIRLERNPEIEKQWLKDYDVLIKKAIFNTGGTIPLLKNPCNTGRIPSLLKQYPNAKFIHIIRNPILIFLSSMKFFTELLPTLWFHQVDKEFIEDMILDIYVRIMEDFFSHRGLIPEHNYIELKFEEFEKDPLAHIRDIYSKFNFKGIVENTTYFEDYLGKVSGYRKNKYYEIDKSLLDRIINDWGFAMEHWDYNVPDFLHIKK